MTSVKAKLKVVLQADDVVVAETEDPVLWQRVLATINGAGSGSAGQIDSSATTTTALATPVAAPLEEGDDAVSKFARRLTLTRDIVEGACSPTTVSPFMHLDVHCWEEMKRRLPSRGPGAISSIAVAATLLALWFREANLGNPTQAQALQVLNTLGVRDHNPARGITGTPWLQGRPGGVVVLNPAQASKAVAVAKSFCSKQWTAEPEGT